MKTLQLVDKYLANEARKANTKSDYIVIFRSPNGETDWAPIKPDEHPQWIKHPQVLGEMLRSNNSLAHPDDPGWYYTAFRLEDAEAFMAAQKADQALEGAPEAEKPVIEQRRPRLVGADGKLLH